MKNNSGILVLERLDSNEELFSNVKEAQKRLIASGMKRRASDLSDCHVVASNDLSAFVVFTPPGAHDSSSGKKEAYAWLWARMDHLENKQDGKMMPLILKAKEICKYLGAETILAGISPSNHDSLSFANKAGFRLSTIYVECDL